MVRRFAILTIALQMMAAIAAAAPPKELKVGDLAPAFELPGSDGKTYKSSDYGGKKFVVIAWFPLAGTHG